MRSINSQRRGATVRRQISAPCIYDGATQPLPDMPAKGFGAVPNSDIYWYGKSTVTALPLFKQQCCSIAAIWLLQSLHSVSSFSYCKIMLSARMCPSVAAKQLHRPRSAGCRQCTGIRTVTEACLQQLQLRRPPPQGTSSQG